MDHERLIQVKQSEKLHKGIILEINTDYLHVLNDQCEHIKIHYKMGCRVGEQIYFLDEDLIDLSYSKSTKKRMSKPKMIRYLGAFAAVLMIVFLINSTLFNVTYAVMSLDINPSLELELNKKGEVIRVLPLNEEAIQLISILTLKGQSYEMAVTKILDQAVLSGYNIDQKSVLIAVAPTQNDSDQMVEDIEKNMAIYTETLSAEVLIGDHQSYEKTKVEGVSLGRHLISEEHPDYDEDDIKHLEIHDLFKRIEQEGDEHESEENEHQVEKKEHEAENMTEPDEYNEQNFEKGKSVEDKENIRGKAADEDRDEHRDEHRDEDRDHGEKHDD